MEIQQIETKNLIAGYNARKHFELDSLKKSIKKNGILEPLLVRPKEDKFEIISGERRWKACKELKIKEVPCHVKKMTDEESANLSFIDNQDREDFSTIEEARHFTYMRDKYQYSAQKLADEYGMAKSQIIKYWSIAEITISGSLVNRLTFRQLYELSKLIDKSALIKVFEEGFKKSFEEWSDKQKATYQKELEAREQSQLNLANEIVEEEYSSKQTEKLVKAKLEIFKNRDDHIKLEFKQKVNQVIAEITEVIGNLTTNYIQIRKYFDGFENLNSEISKEFIESITEDKKDFLAEELRELDEKLSNSDFTKVRKEIGELIKKLGR